MRRLLLVRHAKAEPAVGRDDHDRALTSRGRDDARRVAIALASRKILPDLLIHSGAKRARETAEILAAEWPRQVELREDLELYDATPETMFDRGRALPDFERACCLRRPQPGTRRAGGRTGRRRAAPRPQAHGGQVSDRRGSGARFPGPPLARTGAQLGDAGSLFDAVRTRSRPRLSLVQRARPFSPSETSLQTRSDGCAACSDTP